MEATVIGLGVMGGEICRHVVAAGHRTRACDLSPSAIQRAVVNGAIAATTPAEAANGAEIVLLSLPGPAQVVDAITGEDGVLSASRPPRWIVDLSTNAVGVVRDLSTTCAARGVTFFDGPVSGGHPKAASGRLSLMLGADVAVPDGVLEVLGSFTDRVFMTGSVGTGTVVKLVNNQLFLTACAALQESYLMAVAAGVDIDALQVVLGSSSAAPLAGLAPFLMRRNFHDVGFRLDNAAKDLVLSTELAIGLGTPTPISAAAADLYGQAVADGRGGLDFHGVLVQLESVSGRIAPEIAREVS